MKAQIAAAFRDTERAEARWQKALALAPERPWIWCERSTLLVAADRYDEALEAIDHSLGLERWYRPSVQQKARLLTLLRRDEEAAALLERALDPGEGGVESAAMAGQLALIYAELERPQGVLDAAAKSEALQIVREEGWQRWLAFARGGARLQLGDLTGAADAYEPLAASSVYHAKLVERLRDPAAHASRRVVHAVPFVRQHDRTCAPATLSALTHFWLRPAPQAEIAEEICYGGTFDHQERHWAETHGWAVREFRLSWDSAVALLDAGIPCTLATKAVNSGHLQALVGYDARCGTFLIRDPYERNQNAWLAEEFLVQNAASGPRAMAFVPADNPAAAAALAAAELPEAPLYDALYRLRRALFVHVRAAAGVAGAELAAVDPGARLSLEGRRELAGYDGDDVALLAATDGLLALYPNEGNLRLQKLYLLRRLARPLEARAWLEESVADRQVAEPNLAREYARELAADARHMPRAQQWLARSLFYQPTEPEHLHALADFRWRERDFGGSYAAIRLAATAAVTREDLWQQFFVTSRYLRETDQALRLLGERFRLRGGQSSQLARTLHWAHRERNEFSEAADVLAEALQRRPDDGALLLFAATTEAEDGDHAAAARHLEQARGKVAPIALWRAAAGLADLAADLAGALERWREVLAREPLADDAHRAVVRLLAETDPRGPLAVREYLDAAVARFPHAFSLHQIRVGEFAENPGRGSDEHHAAINALLQVQPTNVWAHRERALAHDRNRQPAEAIAAMDEAQRLSPLDAATFAMRGWILLHAGALAEAQASLRRALELDINSPRALATLLQALPTAALKHEALRFAHAELVRQPVVDQGILAYREAAYALLPDAELQAQLDAALTARPDLWQAWSAAVDQHSAAQRLDQALAAARGAAERFPLLPIVWLDLATVEDLRGDHAAEAEALERVLRIRAGHGDASRRLAAVHRRAGRFAEAQTVLERAIAASPQDVANRGALAQLLWAENRGDARERALKLIVEVIRREPGYDWAWNALGGYARELGQSKLPEELARGFAETRPGEARSWLRLAGTLDGITGAELEERLSALERALALNPSLDDAYDFRADLLARAGRFDDALAACTPPAGAYAEGARPWTLEGRAAWVLAMRGDTAGARERIRRVLADHPAYEWGWRKLADWAEAAGDKAEAIVAAERLAYLSPHDAVPLAYLADARLLAGQRTEAKAAFREAMGRDAKYLYAPSTLLRLQAEDGEWADAEATLAFIGRSHPVGSRAAREVLLAAERRAWARAKSALTELALTRSLPKDDEWVFDAAIRALNDKGITDSVEAALRPALDCPNDANVEAGAQWVLVQARRGKWAEIDRAVLRLPDGEFARRARVAYLGALGDRGITARLGRFLRRRRAELRADTESWGQAGYALLRGKMYRRAVRWMDDWKSREGVKDWMLLNLATSLRALARFDAQALEVSRHALTLPPERSRSAHAAWVAMEDALTDGEAARLRATALYREIFSATKEPAQPYKYLMTLTGLVLAVRGAERGPARTLAYKEAVKTLRIQRRPIAGSFRQSNRATWRAERRAQRRMARDAERWSSRVFLWLFSQPISLPGQILFALIWIFAVVMAFVGFAVFCATMK